MDKITDINGKEVAGIRDLVTLISPEALEQYFKDCGDNLNCYKGIDNDISMPYNERVFRRCRTAVAFACTTAISNNPSYAHSIKVAIGEKVLNGTPYHHFWLEYKGYYIDLTYQQFDVSSPKLTIIEKGEAIAKGLLMAEEILPLATWVRNENNGCYD